MTLPPDDPDRTLPASTPGPAHGPDDGRTLPSGGGQPPARLPAERRGAPDAGEGAEPDRTLPAAAEGSAPSASKASSAAAQPKRREAAGRDAGISESAQGERIGDRFEVVRKLGEGGMGAVYHVRDLQVNRREKALKIIRPEYSRNERFREQFFIEIRSAERFVSEYVNQPRDSGQLPDGRLFMTMDLVDGRPLDDFLRAEGTLAVRHALEITRQVLFGLQSGHKSGFVHRDIKPSNVMLERRVPKTDENPYGVGVKLLDFGIAGNARELEIGQQVGTPYYMSPEQVRGDPLDARSDLFSTGVMLYELLAGGLPFTGRTIRDITTAVLEVDVQPLLAELEHISKPVREIVRKALEKDREKRYQSAGEFIRAIERSPAFKPKVAAPGWLTGVVGLSALAALGAGYTAWDLRAELQTTESERRSQGQKLELQALEIERLNDKAASLEGDNESLRRSFDTGAAGLANQLEEQKQLSSDYKQAMESAEQRNQELVADNEALRLQLEQQRNEFERRSTSVSRFATALRDGLLAAERSEYAAAAADLERALTVEANAEEDELPLEGLATFRALATLARAMDNVGPIEASVVAGGGFEQRLSQIEAIAVQIERERPLIEVDLETIDVAAGYAKGTPRKAAILALIYGGDGRPGLLARVRGELDRLEALLAEEAAASDSIRDYLSGLVSATDIANTFDLLEQYVSETGEMAFALERGRFLVDRLRAALERSDGSLDLGALVSAPDLRPWIAWLAVQPDAEADAMAEQLAQYELARRFRAGSQLPDDLLRFLPAPELSKSPRTDWRASLRLVLDWRLGGTRFGRGGAAEERAYLARAAATTRLYVWIPLGDASDVSATWKRESYRGANRETTYDPVSLRWSGERLLLGDRPLFDLADALGSCQAVLWDPSSTPVVEDGSKTWSDRIERFREREPVPALVFGDEGSTRALWSPELGLLEFREGAYVYTLVAR